MNIDHEPSRYSRPKDSNQDYPNEKDPSSNISYEEKGVMKISTSILVPDYLVSLLIGKNGENIKGIMNKSGSMITFAKEVITIIKTFSITMTVRSLQSMC